MKFKETNIKIIDNFLKEEDLNELNSLILNSIQDNEVKVYHNSIDANKIINNSCIEPTILEKLQKNYHQQYNMDV